MEYWMKISPFEKIMNEIKDEKKIIKEKGIPGLDNISEGGSDSESSDEDFDVSIK